MPDDFSSLTANAVGAGALGLLGRLLHHARIKERRLGWSLLWEIPTAIGMGVLGKGIADALNQDGFPEYAITVAVAYIGPRVIDIGLAEWQRRRGDPLG